MEKGIVVATPVRDGRFCRTKPRVLNKPAKGEPRPVIHGHPTKPCWTPMNTATFQRSRSRGHNGYPWRFDRQKQLSSAIWGDKHSYHWHFRGRRRDPLLPLTRSAYFCHHDYPMLSCREPARHRTSEHQPEFSLRFVQPTGSR